MVSSQGNQHPQLAATVAVCCYVQVKICENHWTSTRFSQGLRQCCTDHPHKLRVSTFVILLLNKGGGISGFVIPYYNPSTIIYQCITILFLMVKASLLTLSAMVEPPWTSMNPTAVASMSSLCRTTKRSARNWMPLSTDTGQAEVRLMLRVGRWGII